MKPQLNYEDHFARSTKILRMSVQVLLHNFIAEQGSLYFKNCSDRSYSTVFHSV